MTKGPRSAPGRSGPAGDRAPRRWRRVAPAIVVALGVASACSGGPSAEPPAVTVVAPPQESGSIVVTTLPLVPEAIPTGSMLLDERFDGGAAEGWAGVSGWRPVAYGGDVGWSSAGSAWAWFPDGVGWTNYAVRLRLRVDAGAVAIGIRAGPDGRYVVEAGPAAVTLLREAQWGSPMPVAVGVPIESGVDHSLTVGVFADGIQVWADGRLVLDHTDPDPLTTGTVTLGAPEGAVVRVGSIDVTGLGADLPALNSPVRPAVPSGQVRPPDAAPRGGPFAGDPGSAPGTTAAAADDLGVGVVRFDQASYLVGDPVTVAVEVLLGGEGPVGPFVVRVEIADAACESTVQSLSNFGSAVATCSIDAVTAPGISAWRVRVDDRGEVAEGDEADNVASGAFVAEEPGALQALPDLVVMWWAADRSGSPGPNAMITFRVKVGPPSFFEGEIGPYSVAVAFDGVVVCDTEVATVEAIVTCPVESGIGAGRHLLGVVVDGGDAVEEGPGESGNAFEVAVDL